MTPQRSAGGNPETAKQARRAAYIATGALAVLPLLALFVAPAQGKILSVQAPVDVTPARIDVRSMPGRWPKAASNGCRTAQDQAILAALPNGAALSSNEPSWRRVIPAAVRARLDATIGGQAQVSRPSPRFTAMTGK